MQFLKPSVAISIFYLRFAVAQAITPIANCSKVFVENSQPGFYYRIYPLSLNGVPNGMPATNATDWVSRLGFMGDPLYTGNTAHLTINNFFTSTPGDVQYGDIFGNNITTTNFTMSANAWFIPNVSGWFHFFIITQSAGELMIINNTDAYCCQNPTNNRIDQQFIITSVNNTADGYVYLYRGFHYQLTTSFVNQRDGAYYYIYVINPSGSYDSVDNYVRQMNGSDPYELVTCNYDVEWFTTTMPYGGTVTTTEYQELYKVISFTKVTIQEWELIGIPSAYYTPPTTTTTSRSSSSVTIDVVSSSTSSSILLSSATNQKSQAFETSSSEFPSYNGSLSIGLFDGSSTSVTYPSASGTELESSSLSIVPSFSTINGDYTSSSLTKNSITNEGLAPNSNIIISQSKIDSNSLVRSSQSSIENSSSNAISLSSYISNLGSSKYSTSDPIFNNVSETSLRSSAMEDIASTTSEVVLSSLQFATVIQESVSLFRTSSVVPGDMNSTELEHPNPATTTFTGIAGTVPVSVPISTRNSDNKHTIVTVITTIVVQSDGYDFRGHISLVGFPDDSENVIKRTITTIITSTMCPICMETITNIGLGGVAPHQQNSISSNNFGNVGAVTTSNAAGLNTQRVTLHVSNAVKPTAAIATFAASPNGQPRFGMNFPGALALIFSTFVLFI